MMMTLRYSIGREDNNENDDDVNGKNESHKDCHKEDSAMAFKTLKDLLALFLNGWVCDCVVITLTNGIMLANDREE